jgi:hypothetical protein
LWDFKNKLMTIKKNIWKKIGFQLNFAGSRVNRVFAYPSFLSYPDRSSHRVNWVLDQLAGPVEI